MNWGLIGCGWIAADFLQSMALVKEAKMIACASQSKSRAEKLAKKYSIVQAYDSYESMLENADIDIVYIATTHNFHYKNALLCLDYGKHLLIEKPIAINALQAAEIFSLAKEKKLFVMEAMWSRFLPLISTLKEVIDSGKIGELQLINADFGFRAELDSENRFYNLGLAGGSLMDMGIYPLTFSNLMFGAKPTETTSSAMMASTGVDAAAVYTLKYGDRGLAKLSTGFVTAVGDSAQLYGTKGMIELDQFYYGKKFTIQCEGEEACVIEAPYEATGKQFEIEEVMNCIKAGKLESSIVPHSESMWYMELMDSFRKKWGLKYPSES